MHFGLVPLFPRYVFGAPLAAQEHPPIGLLNAVPPFLGLAGPRIVRPVTGWFFTPHLVPSFFASCDVSCLFLRGGLDANCPSLVEVYSSLPCLCQLTPLILWLALLFLSFHLETFPLPGANFRPVPAPENPNPTGFFFFFPT